MFGVAAVIVVVATILTWPGTVGPSADERRLADLQRLSHAVDAFRMRQRVLPAALARLPLEPAAPIHTYDPLTNRPYDYRPLGPLSYELCARFDADAGGERRDFWWHDAGRHCFTLETRPDPKPRAGPVARPADAPVPEPAPASTDTPMPAAPAGTVPATEAGTAPGAESDAAPAPAAPSTPSPTTPP